MNRNGSRGCYEPNYNLSHCQFQGYDRFDVEFLEQNHAKLQVVNLKTKYKKAERISIE